MPLHIARFINFHSWDKQMPITNYLAVNVANTVGKLSTMKNGAILSILSIKLIGFYRSGVNIYGIYNALVKEIASVQFLFFE